MTTPDRLPAGGTGIFDDQATGLLDWEGEEAGGWDSPDPADWDLAGLADWEPEDPEEPEEPLELAMPEPEALDLEAWEPEASEPERRGLGCAEAGSRKAPVRRRPYLLSGLVGVPGLSPEGMPLMPLPVRLPDKC